MLAASSCWIKWKINSTSVELTTYTTPQDFSKRPTQEKVKSVAMELVGNLDERFQRVLFKKNQRENQIKKRWEEQLNLQCLLMILKSKNLRRKFQGQGLQLQVSNWETPLPGKDNQARHSVCCPPMYQVLHCPQSLTWTSCEENMQISPWDKGQRTFLWSKRRLFWLLGRCITCLRMKQ
jgi:hypothetical protein